ncbi:MAG: heme-binding domain-containing protein [Chitinophagaceae bacterium]|nr:heme-binding domain-containing protein [Oligoflexus sp.]
MHKSKILWTLLVLSSPVFAHEEDEHKPVLSTESKSASVSPATLAGLKETYMRSIEPIFEAKCYDCHSDKTHYPWYYKIPGVKQYIDSDIAEAREHLDLSKGFPFVSKHEIDHDLEDIGDEVGEGEMPPKAYTFIHRDTKLSPEERQTILNWVKTSRDAIKTDAMPK